jgi:hypothetical protein
VLLKEGAPFLLCVSGAGWQKLLTGQEFCGIFKSERSIRN